MRTIASLRPFPMSAGNFVGNTIEKAAVLPISIPPRKKYLVYSLFTQEVAALDQALDAMSMSPVFGGTDLSAHAKEDVQ